MLVYKFGGGVLHDSHEIRQMAEIVRARVSGRLSQDLFIVVSAFGKMTNAFEELWADWIIGRDFSSSYGRIEAFHMGLAKMLFHDKLQIEEILTPVFDKISVLLKGQAPKDRNEAYDLLVCYGEILSSVLVSAYLSRSGLENSWLDAREMICTDSYFRESKVNWLETRTKVNELVSREKQSLKEKKEYREGRLWLTQGFIGSDLDGRSTTLGREGSDFSAAVFAYVLNASEVVLWKDVPGVMTGDPVDFPEVRKLDQISYLEAIELSYFGAKILHPNTIKPLQNKNIPLIVKHIYHPDAEGTMVIDNPVITDELPVLIIKPNQVLISIQPRDFSFVMEEVLSEVFTILASYHIRINLLQHGAVSLSLCIDYEEERLNNLVNALITDFKILYNTGLDLLTVRHYSQEVMNKLISGRKIYIQQQSRKTARFVLS